jgi:aconitate hydratase
VLPLEFDDPADYNTINRDDVLRIENLRAAVTTSNALTATNTRTNRPLRLRHRLSARQTDAILAGGRIPLLARQQHGTDH